MADDFSDVLPVSQDDPMNDGPLDGAPGIAGDGDAPEGAPAQTDGQPQAKRAPNLRDVLANSGLEPDEIEALDKQFVHKAALQPKREAEKKRLDEMEGVLRQVVQENRQLMARMQQGGQAPQPPKTQTQQFLEEIEADEENKGLGEFLGRFAQAVQKDVMQSMGQYVAPALQEVTQTKQEQLMDRYCEELVPMYGEGVRQLWPQVKQIHRQYMQQGVNMLPENILWGTPALRQQMQQLVTQQQQQNRQRGIRTQTGISMEGFANNAAGIPEMTDEAGSRRNPADSMDTGAILRRVGRVLSNRGGQPLSVSG